MKKAFILALVAVVGGSAFAQSGAAIYNPVKGIKDQGIILKAWGGGIASETEENSLDGGRSI